MHWQIRNQLEVEERAKVLKIVQALNSERYKTEASISLQELVTGGGSPKDKAKVEKRLGEICDETAQNVRKLASEAELLLSPRYAVLRAYMLGRVRTGELWEGVDLLRMRTVLAEMVEDINGYINPERRLWKKRLRFRRVDKRLAQLQLTILFLVTTRFMKISLQDKPFPAVLVHLHSKKMVLENRELGDLRDDYLAAFEELVSGGILEPRPDNEYVVSRLGWKSVARLIVKDEKAWDATGHLILDDRRP
jgi:hypothetical protein